MAGFSQKSIHFVRSQPREAEFRENSMYSCCNSSVPPRFLEQNGTDRPSCPIPQARTLFLAQIGLRVRFRKYKKLCGEDRFCVSAGRLLVVEKRPVLSPCEIGQKCQSEPETGPPLAESDTKADLCQQRNIVIDGLSHTEPCCLYMWIKSGSDTSKRSTSVIRTFIISEPSAGIRRSGYESP